MDHHVIAAFLVPILLAVREVWREWRRKPKGDLFTVVTTVSPLLLTHDRGDSQATGGSGASQGH